MEALPSFSAFFSPLSLFFFSPNAHGFVNTLMNRDMRNAEKTAILFQAPSQNRNANMTFKSGKNKEFEV